VIPKDVIYDAYYEEVHYHIVCASRKFSVVFMYGIYEYLLLYGICGYMLPKEFPLSVALKKDIDIPPSDGIEPAVGQNGIVPGQRYVNIVAAGKDHPDQENN